MLEKLWPSLPKEVTDEWRADYERGLSVHAVANAHGISRNAVRRYLRDHKISVRPSRYYLKCGAESPLWNGGKTRDQYGYILVHSPEHPYCNSGGYVREHRLVMEKRLGRHLLPGEVVDHINGIKDDNRTENLRLFSSNKEHLQATLTGKCPRWSQRGEMNMRRAVKKVWEDYRSGKRKFACGRPTHKKAT